MDRSSRRPPSDSDRNAFRRGVLTAWASSIRLWSTAALTVVTMLSGGTGGGWESVARAEDVAVAPAERRSETQLADPDQLRQLLRWLLPEWDAGGELEGDLPGNSSEQTVAPAVAGDPASGPGLGPAGGPRRLDAIDARAPQNPRHAGWLESARTAQQAGQDRLALELIDQALSEGDQSLAPDASGHWSSIRNQANRWLQQTPAAFRRQFAAEHEPLARQLLVAAKQSQDLAELRSIASRYFHTSAGREAAYAVAMIRLDRGDVIAAGTWLERLAEADDSQLRDPQRRAVVWGLATRLAGTELGRRLQAWVARSGDPITELPRAAARQWTAREPRKLVAPLATDHLWQGAHTDRWAASPVVWPLPRPTLERPLASQELLNRRLHYLADELAARHSPGWLAWEPIIVRDRLVYRDLRGLQVVDLSSGRPVWSIEMAVEPERILTGQVAIPSAMKWRMRMPNFDPEFSGGNIDAHPLANLLLRDQVFGQLSSDGRQVLTIEDHAVLSRNYPGEGGANDNDLQDPYGYSWNSNRLTSYDLATGRWLWSLGGQRGDDAGESSLAETFFHGAPIAVGADWVALASRQSELRLQVLDRVTGQPRWSQLLGYSDMRLEQDLGRRWTALMPAVSQGLAVCPTGLGWLMAVDLMDREIRWAFRYLPPLNGGLQDQPGGQYRAISDWGHDWLQSHPIIVEHRVLMAPPETSELWCLDLTSGRVFWSSEHEGCQAILGVDQGVVVLGGPSRVLGIDLVTGTERWEHKLAAGEELTGPGVQTPGTVVLPLATGELRTLDSQNGQVVSRVELDRSAPRLGRLLNTQGQMISFGLSGLVAYVDRSGRIAELQANAAAGSGSLVGESEADRLTQIELLLADRRWDAGLAEITHFRDAAAASGGLHSRPNRGTTLTLDDLERRALIGVISEQLSHSNELKASPDALAGSKAAVVADVERTGLVGSLQRLRQLSRTAAHQAEAHRLAIAGAWASGDREAVLRELLELLDNTAVIEVSPSDDPDWEVTRDRFVTVELEKVFRGWSPTDPARARAVAEISGAVARTLGKGSAEETAIGRARWRRLLAEARQHGSDLNFVSSSTGAVADWPLVDVLVQDQRLGHAQLSADWLPVLAADAELFELWSARGEQRTARWYGERFVRRCQRIEEQGMDLSALAATRAKLASWLETTGRPPSFADREQWSGDRVRARQILTNNFAQTKEVAVDRAVPWGGGWDVEVDPQDHRLAAHSANATDEDWLPPLRGAHRGGYDDAIPRGESGALLVLAYHGVVHALLPEQRQLLWTWTDDAEFGVMRQSYRLPASRDVVASNSVQSGEHYLDAQLERGCLISVQPKGIVYHGRQRVSVIDPISGQTLWSRRLRSDQQTVTAVTDLVFVVSQDRSRAVAYRLLDGSPVELASVSGWLPNWYGLVGGQVIVWEPRQVAVGNLLFQELFSGWSGPGRMQALPGRLRAHDPMTGRDAWSLELPLGSRVAVLDEDRLLCVRHGGSVSAIDARTGKQEKWSCPPELKSALKQQLTLLVDIDQAYLICNAWDQSGTRHPEYQPATRASGVIACWDLATGNFRWQQTIHDQYLVLDRFRLSPWLIGLARSWDHAGPFPIAQLTLDVLDKRTGEWVHRQSTPFGHGGFHSVQLRPRERRVDLLGYNMRLELTVEPAVVSPEKPASDPNQP